MKPFSSFLRNSVTFLKANNLSKLSLSYKSIYFSIKLGVNFTKCASEFFSNEIISFIFSNIAFISSSFFGKIKVSISKQFLSLYSRYFCINNKSLFSSIISKTIKKSLLYLNFFINWAKFNSGLKFINSIICSFCKTNPIKIFSLINNVLYKYFFILSFLNISLIFSLLYLKLIYNNIVKKFKINSSLFSSLSNISNIFFSKSFKIFIRLLILSIEISVYDFIFSGLKSLRNLAKNSDSNDSMNVKMKNSKSYFFAFALLNKFNVENIKSLFS